MNERTHLVEHCTCAGGLVMVAGQVFICGVCGGSTRRLRGTHDPRSGIDGHDFDSPTDGGGATSREAAGIDLEKPSDARGGGSGTLPPRPRVVSESPESLHAASYSPGDELADLIVDERRAAADQCFEHMRRLVAQHPNDADLGAAVRAHFTKEKTCP